MPEADDGQSRKRSRSGGGKWTADEEATLSELAGRLVGTNAASGESRRAWAQIGHEMGRSAGSVQQHWEVMQGTHPSLDQYGPGRLRGAEAMKPASLPVSAAAAAPLDVNPHRARLQMIRSGAFDDEVEACLAALRSADASSQTAAGQDARKDEERHQDNDQEESN